MREFKEWSPCIYEGEVDCADCPRVFDMDGCDMRAGRELHRLAYEAGQESSDQLNDEEEDQYEPGVLYWHEALDRAHVARDHFFEYVEQHPAIMNDEELKIEAEKVAAVMGDFYQLVGAKYHEFETRHPDPVKAELVEALKEISGKVWADCLQTQYWWLETRDKVNAALKKSRRSGLMNERD